MRLTNFIIPYPVLGIEGDFNEDCVVNSSMTLDTTPTHFIFHINLQLDDALILNLIKENKAAFSCEVDCSKTYYNQTFTIKKKCFDIIIERTSLAGKVQFFFAVIVVSPISDYKNPNFNQRFYSGYKFSLQKGNLLAFLGVAPFNADIKYDELQAIGSIVEVKEDMQHNFTNFDFSGDKIRIFLPSDEFQKFNRTNDSRCADISHASIVQCSLISALYSYKDYADRLWAQTLQVRVKTESELKEFENLAELDSFQISKLVDILLGNANKRMFGSIEKILSTTD